LYRAAQYERRQVPYAADWQSRRADYAARQQAFDQSRARDADCQAWHDKHASDENHQWSDERGRRTA
jgi:hypothetical protein